MAVVELDRPDEGVTRITLNRPDSLNAMTSELVQLLHEALVDSGAVPRPNRFERLETANPVDPVTRHFPTNEKSGST